MIRKLARFFRSQIHPETSHASGDQRLHWSRVVMNDATLRLVSELPINDMSALEISGSAWKNRGFKTYKTLDFPAFDICKDVLDDRFDIVIAEQVLEHVLWPYRAVKNVHSILKPGGYFLVTTPFLVRVHNYPTDCSRWTEIGLKHLLAECGFPLESVVTGSWGNRQCITENFTRWVPYDAAIHSLQNETDFPYHVWALAKKA